MTETMIEKASLSLWEHLFAANPAAGTVGIEEDALVVFVMGEMDKAVPAEWEGFSVRSEATQVASLLLETDPDGAPAPGPRA